MREENIARSASLFQEVEEGVFILHKENESNDYKIVKRLSNILSSFISAIGQR